MGKYEQLLRKYHEHAKRVSRETEIDIDETPKEKGERVRRLEQHYARWFEFYFTTYAKAKCSRFHVALANLIIRYPHIYIIVNWFRGAAKSVHVCMGIPLYLMLVKNDLRFMLLVGENVDKAKILLSDIQIQLKFNNKVINDYGEQFQHGDWADGNFTTRNDVHFMAISVGTSPRGLRYGDARPDYIACSDIDTQKRCNNPTLVRQVTRWIMEDLWGCADAGRLRYIHDNNRISKMSVQQLMTDNFKKAIEQAKQKGFEIRHHISRITAHDKDFTPSWPEKYTKLYWQELYATRPRRSYHREYLDDPMEEGHIFQPEQIRYKKLLPLRQYDALVIYGDLSYKDEGDYKALKFWGKKGREKYLIDCYVRKGSRKMAAEWLYDLFEDLNNKDNSLNITVKIEGLFAQDEFISDFDLEGDQRGWHIPVIADKRPKASKHDRVESMTGTYERGWVFYNEKKQFSPDFAESEAQLLAFEKGSKYPDDSPDADHGAWSELDRRTFVGKFEERIGSDDRIYTSENRW